MKSTMHRSLKISGYWYTLIHFKGIGEECRALHRGWVHLYSIRGREGKVVAE